MEYFKDLTTPSSHRAAFGTISVSLAYVYFTPRISQARKSSTDGEQLKSQVARFHQ
jgi:hypothetical protein